MREIRLAKKIIITLAKDYVHYPSRLITDSIALAARCGILLVLYWYVFNLNRDFINGTPYIIAAWSIFFYFAFSVFRLRDIARMIMNDVKTGNVETLFSKPVSYLLYRMWWQIGAGSCSFLIAVCFGGIVLAAFIGIPSTMKIAAFFPTLLFVFLNAIILSLIIYSIVGLLAFWIEEVNPVFWIVDKAVMILGGSYLPIALFPQFMYKIALYSPFGASQFITHSVYKSWRGNWPFLLGIQLFWVIILGLLMIGMFAKAKEKVSVNGG